MNYWETKFKNGAIWKFEPADSAILVAEYFHNNGIKKVLIPGIGYGRNKQTAYMVIANNVLSYNFFNPHKGIL